MRLSSYCEKAKYVYNVFPQEWTISLFQAKRIQGYSNLSTISLQSRHSSSSSVCDLTSLNFINVINEKGLKSINKEPTEVLSFVGYKCVLI